MSGVYIGTAERVHNALTGTAGAELAAIYAYLSDMATPETRHAYSKLCVYLMIIQDSRFLARDWSICRRH